MIKTKLLDDLTTEQEDLFFKEINYSREQLKLDLQLIKDWCKQQHHLPPSRLKEDDKFFQFFLTGCKGSLETAKRRIDNYYTIRSHSEIYENKDPLDPITLEARQITVCSTLPQTSPIGDRLYICTFSDAENKIFDFLHLSQMKVNRSEIFIRQVGYATRMYLLLDCKGCSTDFIFKLSPKLIRDLLFLLEEVYPVRILKLAFVNVPSFLTAGINTIIVPLLSKKIKERLNIASDGLGDVLKYFDPEMLPRDYGGLSTNPSFKEFNAKWEKCEEENRMWFINELSERVDESKRIKTDEYPANPYFGVHGSLKKLVID